MKYVDRCANKNGSGLYSLKRATENISACITPLTETEFVPIKDSLGRIVAADIQSAIAIPPHRNSSMDGYALSSRDISNAGTSTLAVSGTSWAGKPYRGTLLPGQCVRIFTGAAVPENADAVIIQEDTRRINDSIQISTPVNAGDNIRYPGDDIKIDQTIITAAKRLTPFDLGILSSIGRGTVPVIRKLRVAFFSTGNELRSVGQKLEFGNIYDSNRYLLHGLLDQFGADILDMGVIKDHPDSITVALKEAAAISDVVITTGGASVGDADYLHQSLEKTGKIKLWKIAIKPGKPLLFGEIEGRHYFGLPGNPVSVAVTFNKVVLPALKIMTGEYSPPPLRFKVRCNSKITKVPGRQEFQRGILQQEDNGELIVRPFCSQGSHVLSSMSHSNCFIVLAAESTGVNERDYVDIELFESL